MQLRKLELQEFRQFRDGEIEFAMGEGGGVTVVHGANGSGKTTLLNAFTWLFYGDVDFSTRPERLVNEGAIAEVSVGSEITVRVKLEFSHEGTEYRAEREAVYRKQSEGDFDGALVDMNLTLEFKERDQWSERPNPANSLDQIVPQRLSSLFFFDGEDIDELAGIKNQDRIQEAIQSIMGLTILERATRHLGDAARRFEDEVDETASEETSRLIAEKREIEEEIERLERKRNDLENNKDRTETEIRDIEQKYEALDEAAALQKQRDEAREAVEELEAEIEEINEEIRSQINSRGFVPVAMPLMRETAEELDEMRAEGKIPSELSDSYLNSLLNAGQCICGRPLEEGTEHYEQLAAMRGDAVAEGVERSSLRIIDHLNQMTDMETEFSDAIDDLIAERQAVQAQVDEKEGLLDDIRSELKDMDATTESGESPEELENLIEKKESKRDELMRELGSVEKKIEEQNELLEEKRKEVDEQEEEEEETILAKRRQKAAKLVEDELDTAFNELKGRIRKRANKKIRQTFNEIASKGMTAEITEDFELKIQQQVGSDQLEVDKSTGERQIASLAFIGSLVDIAREQYESDSDSEYFTGGIYPIVMDSPFGALDKSHRRRVSRVIPSLANQVVVFATDSQWEGPVEEEMSKVVGQQYWLNFNDGGETGSPRTGIKKERIATQGDQLWESQ